jgi:hypothetical protein
VVQVHRDDHRGEDDRVVEQVQLDARDDELDDARWLRGTEQRVR